MGLFSRNRYVVSTIMVALDTKEAPSVVGALEGATRRIEEGDHAAASAAIAAVAGYLLERQSAWTHAANWGEIFNDPSDAARYGDEVFADCAGRYLSSDLGEPEERSVQRDPGGGGHLVVMLTVAYEGENPAFERTIATRVELDAALSRIVALHHRDALEVASVHFAPAHAGEVLSDDQLLMNFPELLPL